MCEPVSIMTGLALAGSQIYMADQQASSQREAMASSRKMADKQQKDAEAMLAMQSKRSRRASLSDMIYGRNPAGSATNISGSSGAAVPQAQIGKITLLGG